MFLSVSVSVWYRALTALLLLNEKTKNLTLGLTTDMWYGNYYPTTAIHSNCTGHHQESAASTRTHLHISDSIHTDLSQLSVLYNIKQLQNVWKPEAEKNIELYQN